MHAADREDLVFVFDFDGVIADSIGALRGIYYQFLESFGKVGSEAEFSRLNGPKLTEIVALLKRWHMLPPSEEVLLCQYMQRIHEHYSCTPLVDGVKDALGILAALGIPAAIATASVRKEVMEILAREGLLDAFALIVTGDEVKEAKPSAAIYLQIKTYFPGRRCIVLEDSENGMKAALAAGLESVFFDPNHRGTSLPVTASLYGFCRFPGLLEEVRRDCFTLTSCAAAEVRIVPAPPPPDAATEARVSSIWQKESQRRSLHDSNILCYAAHRMAEGNLYVDAFMSKYRYFLARLQDESISVNVTPLSVSGFILDTEGRTLAARRGAVTEYPGLLELVPSGGIDMANVISGRADFVTQILAELVEETGIPDSAVTLVSPHCLIHDAAHGVVDLGCEIRLGVALKDVLPKRGNAEYQDFLVLSPETLVTDTGWVPVSGVIVRNRLFAIS